MKQIANQLKKQLKQALPEYTFSIVSDHNSIRIAVMSGPGEFKDHEQLNPFAFRNNEIYYRNNHPEELKRVFNKVDELLEKLQPTEIVSVCPDYGSYPNYYKNYHVGKWDKPYKRIEKDLLKSA